MISNDETSINLSCFRMKLALEFINRGCEVFPIDKNGEIFENFPKDEKLDYYGCILYFGIQDYDVGYKDDEYLYRYIGELNTPEMKIYNVIAKRLPVKGRKNETF